MRHPTLLLFAVVASCAALVAGCGTSSSPTAPTTSQTDQAQVTATLAAAASLVDDGLAEDGSQISASSASSSAFQIEGAIRPFTWW